MFGTQDLPLFIIAGLLLNFTPGPDTLFIMSRSASGGFRAGAVAALGIGSGVFVHVFAAALGLSALLATSATAFTVIKYVGAAYLLYVGITMLRSKPTERATSVQTDTPDASSGITDQHASYRQIFLQGFLTNVLNPKVALFFLAFVPQFIAPDASNKPLAFIVLGCIFNFNGMLWCHLVAYTTAFASQRVRLGPQWVLWLNRGMGALFVSFGIKLALAER